MTATLEKHTTFSFEIIHKSKKSNARVGKIHTAQGIKELIGSLAKAKKIQS